MQVWYRVIAGLLFCVLCVYAEDDIVDESTSSDDSMETKSVLIQGIRDVDSVFYQGVIDFSKDAERASGYLEKACKAKHPGACFYLGSYYETRAQNKKSTAQSKQNNEKAQEYYKQGYEYSFEACKQGATEWCAIQAVAFIDGRGVSKDIEKGFRYLSIMCERDIAEACSVLGTYYFYGVNTAQDLQQAQIYNTRTLEIDGKACDERKMYACVLSAEIYQQGLSVSQDLVRAKDLYRRACDLRNDFACDYVKKLK